MIGTEVDSTKYMRAEKSGLCPICGDKMLEAERLKEGQNIYIWFVCQKRECTGQWLQKKSSYSVF